MLDPDLNPKEVDVRKPIPTKDLGCNLTKDDIIPSVGIIVNPSQPMQNHSIPTQTLEGLTSYLNKDFACYSECKLKQKDSDLMGTCRFTCSMAMVSISVMIQQHKESPLIEVVSDHDDPSPICEIYYNYDE